MADCALSESMDVIEPLKRLAEKATGIGIPRREEALACVRDCRPSRMKFRDDGYIPNNPTFPLRYYRKALRFGHKHDRAAVLEKTFRGLFNKLASGVPRRADHLRGALLNLPIKVLG